MGIIDYGIINFGHLNFRDINHLKKENMVSGLPEIQISSEMCEECLQAKQHKNSFSKDAETTLEHLLKLYTLACLYYQVDSIGGNKYSVTFIDYFSIKFEHT